MSIALSSSITNLALLYQKQGMYEKAEKLHLRSLAIHEKILGAEHPFTALVLSNLGYLYNSQGLYATAESVFMRSLAIREKVFDAEDPHIAASLDELAAVYYGQGICKGGAALSALLVIKEKVGEEHAATSATLNNLGLLYYRQGLTERRRKFICAPSLLKRKY